MYSKSTHNEYILNKKIQNHVLIDINDNNNIYLYNTYIYVLTSLGKEYYNNDNLINLLSDELNTFKDKKEESMLSIFK